MLMCDEKTHHVAVPAKHLHQFEVGGTHSSDETWVHYFTVKSPACNGVARDLQHPKILRQLSADKIMASVL
jgi:hypothetical protein